VLMPSTPHRPPCSCLDPCSCMNLWLSIACFLQIDALVQELSDVKAQLVEVEKLTR
jgi:hypothetical protein